MERNVLKVFGTRLLPIKDLSTKLWLHTMLWFFFWHFGRNQVMSLWWWSLTGVVRGMVSTWLIRERPVHFFVRTRDVRTYWWSCQDMILAHWNASTHLQVLIYMYMYMLHVWQMCIYTYMAEYMLNILCVHKCPCPHISSYLPISISRNMEHVFMSSKTQTAFAQFLTILRSKKDRMNILKFQFVTSIFPWFLDTKQFGKGFPWKPRQRLGIPISSSCVSQVVWIWWWSSCWSCILAETRICGGRSRRESRLLVLFSKTTGKFRPSSWSK